MSFAVRTRTEPLQVLGFIMRSAMILIAAGATIGLLDSCSLRHARRSLGRSLL
jgi:hypothetical protein